MSRLMLLWYSANVPWTFRAFLHTAKLRWVAKLAMTTAIEAQPSAVGLHQKRKQSHLKGHKRSKKLKPDSARFEGTHEEVLLADVRKLAESLSLSDDHAQKALPELQSEVELTVKEISSTGDALAVDAERRHVYVVPFSIPGDTVTAKVYKTNEREGYSLTDLVKINGSGPERDNKLIRCPYFAKCSGCQFQMIPYSTQLQHKRGIVVKAYENFSSLSADLIPTVGQTVGSPLEYGYRTKLTPHFDGPPDGRRHRRQGKRPRFREVPPIGFMKKNTRQTIDIEDCPIGTEAVRDGLKNERQRVRLEIDKYVRGATLLLRESTKRVPNATNVSTHEQLQSTPSSVVEERGRYVHEKTCVTDNNALSTEYVDDFIFENPAGAFFQNNNSILPTFTRYIREQILAPQSHVGKPPATKLENLVDAYSGSGLFTITLSSLFKRSIGIDIAASSIASATKNAELNGLPSSQASFIAADAANLFASIADSSKDQYMNPAQTVVVIDPPRKGCDDSFLRQLLKYNPERIIYVSCNVHTQARDVGILVGGARAFAADYNGEAREYEIESLRGFDFFPQTGHVESVAVLQRLKC